VLPPPTGPLATALGAHGAVVVVVVVEDVDDLAAFVVEVVAGFVVVVVVDEHGAPLDPSAWAPVPTPLVPELVPAAEPV
jgi:hypothetical protein